MCLCECVSAGVVCLLCCVSLLARLLLAHSRAFFAAFSPTGPAAAVWMAVVVLWLFAGALSYLSLLFLISREKEYCSLVVVRPRIKANNNDHHLSIIYKKGSKKKGERQQHHQQARSSARGERKKGRRSKEEINQTVSFLLLNKKQLAQPSSAPAATSHIIGWLIDCLFRSTCT